MRKFYYLLVLFPVLLCLSLTSCKHKGVHDSTYMKDITYMNCDSIIAIEYIEGKPDTTIIIRDLNREQNGEPIYDKDVFGREVVSRWEYVYHTNSGKDITVKTWNQNFIRDLDTKGEFVIIAYKDNDGETKIYSGGKGHFYIGKQRAISSVEDVDYFSTCFATGVHSKETIDSIYIYSNGNSPVVRTTDSTINISWLTLRRNEVVDTAAVAYFLATLMDDIKAPMMYNGRYVHINGHGLCPIDRIVLYENGIIDTAAMLAYMNITENIRKGVMGGSGGGANTWYSLLGGHKDYIFRSSDANSE